jgi:hypothetical protein
MALATTAAVAFTAAPAATMRFRGWRARGAAGLAAGTRLHSLASALETAKSPAGRFTRRGSAAFRRRARSSGEVISLGGMGFHARSGLAREYSLAQGADTLRLPKAAVKTAGRQRASANGAPGGRRMLGDVIMALAG